MATTTWSTATGAVTNVAGTDEYNVAKDVTGATINAAGNNVEVTVDMATTTVNEGAGTRVVTKAEVLTQLQRIMDYITKDNWPPS